MVRGAEVVAVIGGGASGALTAIHLQQAAPAGVRVMIIEPRGELGRGVAYGTTDLGHLLNVRAGCLSALPDVPGHFTAWARQRTTADAQSFLPRAWYGDYLQSVLQPVEHVQARAVDVVPVGTRLQIELSDGRRRTVDQVVLAPGASPGAWPLPLGGTGERWIGDPWAPGALAGLRPGEAVLLVGTGLTAVDTALSLQACGHQIVATSRHGWLPAAHPDRPLPPLRLAPPRCPTARSLLAWARAHATELGDWRPVVDALRPHTDHLWGTMTEADRLRLLRHTQRRWEVLRHRMPAAVAMRIEAMQRTGQLTLIPGDIRSARQIPGGVEVAVGDRCVRVGAVINCTGPSVEVRRSRHPLVRRLLDRRVIHPGPLGLGLDTTVDGQLGAGAGVLWLVGPLRRGRCWETTAIPEIRAQAADLPRSLFRLDAMVGA
jgi:uncharacterized NAD(P)/FAD-binding protein YdhS